MDQWPGSRIRESGLQCELDSTVPEPPHVIFLPGELPPRPSRSISSASSGRMALSQMIKDYIELTKPRITWLILMSTAVGFYFGARGMWSFWPILHTILGTALIASGT